MMCFTAVHVTNQSCPSLPMVRCVCRCQRLPTASVFQEKKTSSRAGKGKLTSCELEKIWLAERESSSEDSSESSRAIWLRLGMLLESGLSSSGSRSLRSRLSTERLRTPQLKLSMVSPCDTHSRSWSYCTLPTIFISPPAHVRKHTGHKKFHTGSMFRAAFKDDFSSRSYMMSLNTSRANKLIFYFTT